MIGLSDDIRVIALELFDAAFPIAPDEEESVKQRFMTLFQHEEGRKRGSAASVYRVTNLYGETFALKRFRVLGLSGEDVFSGTTGSSKKELRRSGIFSGNSGSVTPDYVTQGHVAVLYEEYRVHMAVSNLRGYPKLYGFGLCNGDPVIVMEWVEGVSLDDYLKERVQAQPDKLLPLMTVADFGISVLSLLARSAELDDKFVHRDISPRNIVIRTDEVSADDQFSTGEFDLCLLDFGSSSLMASDAESASFTLLNDVWRMGTPSYAPPEMLTSDVVLPDGWRQSETIDTYALCSVLYELYSGDVPFHFEKGEGVSPYRAKTEEAPKPLVRRAPDGGAFANIIATGLSVQQADRPKVGELKAALENWKRLPSQKSIGALRGARPSDSAFWQPGYARKAVTRRAMISAALVTAAAVVAGVMIVRKAAPAGDAFDASRYTRADARYSGPALFKAFDGKHPGWMLCTENGEIVCKPETSRECGALREGLVALYDDISQRYGYIAPDESAAGYAWYILPGFAQAGDFSEGLAAAQSLQTKMWGYIDYAGEWVIEPQFNAASAFVHGVASVQSANEKPLWGAIDRSGSWLLEPRFSQLGTFSETGYTVAEASDDDLQNLKDTLAVEGANAPKNEPTPAATNASSAEVLSDLSDERASTFDVASGAPAQRQGTLRTWGIVDLSGSWICPPGFAQLRSCEYGPAPALDGASGKWGFVDSKGNWVIEPAFRDARPFYPDDAVQDVDDWASSTTMSCLAAVQDANSQLWYFIGTDGAPRDGMEPRFWKLGDLHYGLAPAQATAKDDTVVFDDSEASARVRGAGKRYGYVDAAGNWRLKRLTTLTDTAIGPATI